MRFRTNAQFSVSTSPSAAPTVRRRSRFVTIVAAAAMAGLIPLATTACSSDATPVAEASVAEGAVLLDVRTPEEFATGHLEGAINIDIQSADFDARVSELDPDATYLVYCRSGNRSGQAMSRMQAQGFTDLTNLGSVAEANAATGVRVIQ